MATTNESGVRTFTAETAVEPFRRVALGTGANQVAHAGNAAKGVGVTLAAAAAGAEVAVKLWAAPGTHKIEAAGIIGVNALVTAAADGKIATGGTVDVGYNLTGAAADGSIQEVAAL